MHYIDEWEQNLLLQKGIASFKEGCKKKNAVLPKQDEERLGGEDAKR